MPSTTRPFAKTTDNPTGDPLIGLAEESGAFTVPGYLDRITATVQKALPDAVALTTTEPLADDICVRLRAIEADARAAWLKASRKPAKVSDDIAEKARVVEIRKRILGSEGAHPEDVSWVAAEAYRMHIVRENMLRKLKFLAEFKVKTEAWLKTVAHFDMTDLRDGGDATELAGGWNEEARALLLSLEDPAPAGSCPSGDPIPGHVCTYCPPEHIEATLGKERIEEAIQRQWPQKLDMIALATAGMSPEQWAKTYETAFSKPPKKHVLPHIPPSDEEE